MSEEFRPLNSRPPVTVNTANETAGTVYDRYVVEPVVWAVGRVAITKEMAERIEAERAELNERLKDQWNPRLGPGRPELDVARRRLWPLSYRFGLTGRPAGPFRRAS